jgi:hypothetical protein
MVLTVNVHIEDVDFTVDRPMSPDIRSRRANAVRASQSPHRSKR